MKSFRRVSATAAAAAAVAVASSTFAIAAAAVASIASREEEDGPVEKGRRRPERRSNHRRRRRRQTSESSRGRRRGRHTFHPPLDDVVDDGDNDAPPSTFSFSRPSPENYYADLHSGTAKRSDLDPTAPIHPSRFVSYENHPYDGRRRRRRTDADAAAISDGLDDDDESGPYEPLRIHFDVTDLRTWSSRSSDARRRVDRLIRRVLPGTSDLWSEALSVIPVSGRLSIERSWCPYGSPDDSPSFNGGARDADLVVFVTANGEACRGGGVLASANSCFWDQYERPTAGYIDFCLDALQVGTNANDREGNDDISPASLDDAEEEDQGGKVTSDGGDDSGDGWDDEDDVTIFLDDPLDDDKLLRMAIGTATHEFAHVLGVTSSDVLFFYDRKTGLPRTTNPVRKQVPCVGGDGDGDRSQTLWMPSENTLRPVYDETTGRLKHYEIVTPTVAQVVRNQFDCQSLQGARLENQPTSGDCFGTHFDERLFFTEAMSPVMGGVPEILSSLTLALLHDSGWYHPNYEIAKVSPFGHAAGCDFVEKPCLTTQLKKKNDNDKGQGMSNITVIVPEYGRGFFCSAEYKFDSRDGTFWGEYGCDPTHTHMGICNLVDYEGLSALYARPSEKFQYFPDRPTLGSLMETTDFCPTYSLESLSCGDVRSIKSGKIPPLVPAASRYESYSAKARCFNTVPGGSARRPICLDAKCDASEQLIKVRVGTTVFTCLKDGQVHAIPGTDVRFVCPNLSIMCPDLLCPANCAGHGVCDYEDPPRRARCRCFDDTDDTAGCFGGGSRDDVPPRIAWSEAYEGNGGVGRGARRGWWSLFRSSPGGAMESAMLAGLTITMTTWHGWLS